MTQDRILSRLPVLDHRLTQIAALVPVCEMVADIGCDHGKLACWLVGSGRCQSAIASDISRISRMKARDLFERHGLLDRISIREEDGLLAIRGDQPETVVMAGLGGGVIAQMLAQEVSLSGARLIISAHSELPRLRKAILKRGYQIVEEWVVRARGRFYLVMNAIPGDQELTEQALWLGQNLKSTKTATWQEYYSWQLQVAGQWQSEIGQRYRAWLKEALSHEKTQRQDDI